MTETKKIIIEITPDNLIFYSFLSGAIYGFMLLPYTFGCLVLVKFLTGFMI